ncbi:probable protein phosphatase 2C 55 [Phragmites australis]|uniref:probable protein phosphatase 2C 55 n=1 Tax=Phragmites australis TaxID=29695 RepID=UPI002D782C30|nr:probable protein phosphatase 2C 55 [Phragmites australis]
MLAGYGGGGVGVGVGVGVHLSSHKDLLLDRGGRSFLFGNTWFLLSSYPARLLHTADRGAPATFFAAIHRAPCVRSHCAGQGLLQRGGIVMAACGYAFWRAELGATKRQPDKDPSLGTRTSRIATMGSVGSAARPDVSFRYRGVECCKKVGASLKCREPWGDRAFWTNGVGPGWKLSSAVEPWTQYFSTSCVAPYSAGATEHQLSLDEKMDNSTASDGKSPTSETLKLLSGSCYLPHPAKEATGGEDAHFICVDEHVIGVADGVGGWADLGVDAGLYAKELMSNSMSVIKDESVGAIDPSRVLEKAYMSTKARGSSTACIITLKEQGIHAVNLGDSGFVVVRDGRTVLRSPTQQHDFNFTYQLESGGGSDLPSSAQVFHFAVAPGDVIVAGTDGLFDNLYNNEISGVVVEALRVGLSPQAAAQKIAALARQRAMDKNRQSPFAAAAQEAGYRYYGGKLDDITVVVSYVKSASAA